MSQLLSPDSDHPSGSSALEASTQDRDRVWRRSVVAISLCVGLALAGVLFWYKVIKPECFPRNFGVVKEGAIYRSAQNRPRVLRRLCEEHGIKTILDLGGARGYDARTQAQRDVAAQMGIERFEFLLPSDGTGDPDKYVEALLLMSDPARQPVLVHCGSGAQRTSTLCILYRVMVDGENLAAAYKESFTYKHKPDQWVLLAYLAETLPYIQQSFAREYLGDISRRESSTQSRRDYAQPG